MEPVFVLISFMFIIIRYNGIRRISNGIIMTIIVSVNRNFFPLNLYAPSAYPPIDEKNKESTVDTAITKILFPYHFK